MTNEKVKKLVDLATTDGFVSAMSIDPYREEKQYAWLKELQVYMLDKHNLEVETTHNSTSDKYLGMVFTRGGALVGDLYDPYYSYEYKEEALFQILTATFEYLNSPEQCARCSSRHTSVVRYGDNNAAYHCQDCGAVTVENEMIGEIGIEVARTRSTIDTLRGYTDAFSQPLTEGQQLYADIAREQDTNNLYVAGVDPISARTGQSISIQGGQIRDVQALDEMPLSGGEPVNDLGTNLRWQTSEDFFSDQMAELNRVTPFDEAEDGSTQYSVGSTRRSRSRINNEELVPREVHELRDRAREAMEHPEHGFNTPRPDITDYMEVELGDGSVERVRTYNNAYQQIIEQTEAEIDRLYSSVGIARSRMSQNEALATMRSLAEQTGVIPINSTVNPNDDF